VSFDKTAMVNKAQVLADKLVEVYPNLQSVQVRVLDQILESAFNVIEAGDRRKGERRAS